MLILKKALEEHGLEMEPEEFRCLVSELALSMFPLWSVDEILCNPDEGSIPLCKEVFAKLGKKIPKPIILKTLLNLRRGNFEESIALKDR
jgi:hypothetical protein